jgi:hypothetical protein
MKYDALFWLRMKMRCMLIATEVGGYSADVLGVNEERMIEIEIKTTFQDFKNDFKKYKHSVYTNYFGVDHTTQWVPNHFYYAVPSDLVEKVANHLGCVDRQNVDLYGIICSDNWMVHKRAKWLHKDKPNSRVKGTVALRMGSELVRFHEAWL